MIALLVMFTGIGLLGLLMLLTGARLQATRVEALQREANATMMKAEAMMADRQRWSISEDHRGTGARNSKGED